MSAKNDKRTPADAAVNWAGIARFLGYPAAEIDRVRRLPLEPSTPPAVTAPKR